jgi:hypothetical protein
VIGSQRSCHWREVSRIICSTSSDLSAKAIDFKGNAKSQVPASRQSESVFGGERHRPNICTPLIPSAIKLDSPVYGVDDRTAPVGPLRTERLRASDCAENEKGQEMALIWLKSGGADETRTRDLRRDRPAF